jgi:type VI secretion system protein ImpM
MDETPLLFFGKVPGRGDFVRSQSDTALLSSIDSWIGQGMELIGSDAHWKQMYDHAPHLEFALLGISRPIAVVGYLAPSIDSSGRRYPFISACTFDLTDAVDFLQNSPLQMVDVWEKLKHHANEVMTADQGAVADVLQSMTAKAISYAIASEERRDRFSDYLELSNLQSLESSIRDNYPTFDLRQTVLAIGLLFQPLLSNAGNEIDKGVSLPLPTDPQQQMFAATFWLHLISVFFRKSAAEVSVFLPRGEVIKRPSLLISFNTGSPEVLQAALDSRATPDVFIDLGQSPWIEEHFQNDYGVKKLSSYLQVPQLSLLHAKNAFMETFVGL